MAVATEIEQKCVDTIRTLSMDAVQSANSGHPGTPMAMAPVAYTLFNDRMAFDPEDPIWPNRDRFVLSMGHASMLLYSLLHLCGVKAVSEDYERLGELSVSLEDIKRFRQLGSKCPGHPEYRWTSGVETTTGPLGQGVAASVGMAIASKWQAARYNRPGFELFNFNVYALAGDGCMMEGASSEAASMAGHLGLSNLCWIYDNNKITIEGETDLAFSEDVATRFIAMGWNVSRVGDANDLERMRKALDTFEREEKRPTLIIVDSHIGFGAPTKEGSHEAHGAPLGEEEIRGAKRNYGWDEDAKFHVPDDVRAHFSAGIGARGSKAREDWEVSFQCYKREHPELAEEISLMQSRELPDGWDSEIPTFLPGDKPLAGRAASGKVLNALAKKLPWLIGGSADLAPSTKTTLTFEGAGDFTREDYGGRNFHFGVRELAMGSVLNGLSTCKVRPYGSGFMVFSDFSRPAIRLAALMELPVVYIFTHDSIGVGEDGPTHQPVEHLAALRAIPGVVVLRPGDPNEVAECYRMIARERRRPMCLVLSRQNMVTLDRDKCAPVEGAQKGAYILADSSKGEEPEVILMASGTEVATAMDAFDSLEKDGIAARVLSVVSWEIFEDQSEEYQAEVLPPTVRTRVAIEAGSTFGWERYVGIDGAVVGMKTFGASAPLKELQKKYGFTPEAVVETAKRLVASKIGKAS